MMEKKLRELGLSKIKIVIYKEILIAGSCKASSIADKIGVDVEPVVRMCESLEGMGLLSVTDKNGVLFYNAEPLEAPVQTSSGGGGGGIMSLFGFSGKKSSDNMVLPKVSFFEGKDGIKDLYNNILDIGMPIDSFEDNGQNMADFFPDFVEYFIKERVNRNISNRVICSSNNVINTESIQNMRSVKNIFQNDFPITGDIKICGSTVNLISFKEGESVGVTIKDKAIADNFRAIFNYIWDTQ